MANTMHVLSLGAGVQSTTMALMAAHGEITPMPRAAIFADTGWEPKAIYDHLDWLEEELAGLAPQLLVYRVNNGNIRDDLTRKEPGRYASMPFFLDDGSGQRGMGRRQCTHEYKLKPLMWQTRRLLNKGRRDRIAAGAVTTWIGISTDEAVRMKPSGKQWQVNRWPLIEAGMSRRDCLNWMKRHGYPEPGKSSCIGCPFHNDLMWRDMKQSDPESWDDAVEVDRLIRSGGTYKEQTMRGAQYMHASLTPLEDVDLRNAEDRGQLNMFNNECEGMCGV